MCALMSAFASGVVMLTLDSTAFSYVLMALRISCACSDALRVRVLCILRAVLLHLR